MKHLRDYINEQAKKTPDKPDHVPHVPGTIRGKKWVPPKQPSIMEGYGFEDDIELDIDLGKDMPNFLGKPSLRVNFTLFLVIKNAPTY